MAPVTGGAVARLLLCRLLMVIFSIYVIISAQITNGCVLALWAYDRDSLFCIKELMEGLFDKHDRNKQAFPPPFAIDPDSPDYLLLCRAPGRVRRRSRRRGLRSGIQVGRRRAAARGGSIVFGRRDRARCLRRIPLLDVCDSVSTPPPARTTTGVLDPSQRWSCGQGFSSPPSTSVFVPALPAWTGWRPRDRWTCLRPIPLRNMNTAFVTSSKIYVGLLNARSIANKSHSLNDLFSRESLDIMCFSETWQREEEFIHLNELCPAGCSVVGKPRPCRRGGGLAIVHRDVLKCNVIQSQEFSSFELQMIKVGVSSPFYCMLVYRPPGPAAFF